MRAVRGYKSFCFARLINGGLAVGGTMTMNTTKQEWKLAYSKEVVKKRFWSSDFKPSHSNKIIEGLVNKIEHLEHNVKVFYVRTESGRIGKVIVRSRDNAFRVSVNYEPPYNMISPAVPSQKAKILAKLYFREEPQKDPRYEGLVKIIDKM